MFVLPGSDARSWAPPTTTTRARSSTCPLGDDDIAYLLEALNGFFETELAVADLTGAYAGVRPLISTGDPKKSVDISRKAELYETSSGLVTITGGKLTTWRRMAKLAVDRIVEREGREAPCRTHEIPLGLPVDPDELQHVPSVDAQSREHLARSLRPRRAVRAAPRRGRAAAGARISPGLPDIAAEAAFAAAHEQASAIGDVLLRRTRLGLLDARTLAAPQSEAGAVAGALAAAARLGRGSRPSAELAAWGGARPRRGASPGSRAPAPEEAA